MKDVLIFIVSIVLIGLGLGASVSWALIKKEFVNPILFCMAWFMVIVIVGRLI